MKQIYTCLFIGLLFTGCKKEIIPDFSTPRLSFSDSAKSFLKTNLSPVDFNALDTNSFQVLQVRNVNTGIKVAVNNSAQSKSASETFILLKRSGNTFTGHRVTMDGINISKKHNGTILLETLDGKFMKQYIVENNRVTRKQTSTNSRANEICAVETEPDEDPAFDKLIKAKTDNCELPEVVITSVRGGRADCYSLYWMFNQNSMYYYYYTPTEGGSGTGTGGGSGTGTGGGNGAVAAPAMYSPETPTKVVAEVKCFTNNPSATYSITVNVNQPIPGSRDVFDPLKKFMVGHTFLTLQQTNPDGSSIVRNIGWYPKDMVKPGNETDDGTFADDSETPFDISLKISVSGNDFLTVISSLIAEEKLQFNLDNFNCTNSALTAFLSIGVHLPDTKSNVILFSGNNPADLGEDIKNLDLNKFKAENGNRQVVRTQASDNTQKPPAKKGGC